MTIEKRGANFWALLNKKEARKLFINSSIKIYQLHNDNSESVIHTRVQLEMCLFDRDIIGIFLGVSNESR